MTAIPKLLKVAGWRVVLRLIVVVRRLFRGEDMYITLQSIAVQTYTSRQAQQITLAQSTQVAMNMSLMVVSPAVARSMAEL